MNTGFSLFEHAVRLVFRHLGAAFRISALLYFTPILLLFGIQLFIGAELREAGEFSVTGFMLTMSIALVALFGTLWVAVAWHRFILLGETTSGWIPDFNGRRVFTYLGKSIMLFVLAFLVALLPGFLVGVLGGIGGPALAIAGGVVLIFFIYVLFYRVGPILPASSVDHSMSIKEAWRATSSATGSIIVLAIICAIAQFVISLPSMLLGGLLGPVFATVWDLFAGWLTLLVSISILTTLYGHYVEGRPLTN